MPRLNVIDPASATGEAKNLFDGPLKGKELNIFKGMANSPAAINAYLGMGGALDAGTLSKKEREVVALAVSEANNCGYCQAAHTAIGKSVGLTDEQTIQARRGRVEGDEKLAALARFATALDEKKGFVSGEDLNALRSAGYGDGAVVEAVATYAQTIFSNYFNHVNETEVDFPAAPSIS